ncbi:hypothetical protein MJ575_20455 [Klebsiella pneumoniae]|nr:hypothetical protein MJ575_20455 [Klebsiella pneumoniae]
MRRLDAPLERSYENGDGTRLRSSGHLEFAGLPERRVNVSGMLVLKRW